VTGKKSVYSGPNFERAIPFPLPSLSTVLFIFLILYTFCRTPWTGDQPVTRPLPTHRTTLTHNKT
jgi:hypothetical protein